MARHSIARDDIASAREYSYPHPPTRARLQILLDRAEGGRLDAAQELVEVDLLGILQYGIHQLKKPPAERARKARATAERIREMGKFYQRQAGLARYSPVAWTLTVYANYFKMIGWALEPDDTPGD